LSHFEGRGERVFRGWLFGRAAQRLFGEMAADPSEQPLSGKISHRMKSIVVGTAGHIDHGKTALVKALTGIDADRLAEEKRRGITIDLGFAHMNLPAANGETLRVAFVDVPGHERFVRNMLAGAGGIDLVLLVIAADEAIKPQTREHFDILQLLGVNAGITVLTKSDAVDPETLEVVRLEVEEFLRGTFLEKAKAPMISVSSLTGAGLEKLKQAIAVVAGRVHPRDSQAIGRLPVDRVFTMKGFGPVVTGTLVSGTIRREDEMEVLPGGRRVRVRGVQLHGEKADTAIAGQRTALNIAGAGTEELVRGMTLLPPAMFETTRRMDVSLKLLGCAPRALKNRARVHFHSFTMESVAEVLLHGTKQVAPGETAFARLKFLGPVFVLPGDRFIIRQFSPVLTIGGGSVLDTAIMPRALEHAEFLKIIAAGTTAEAIAARIARRRGTGISISRLIAETGWCRNKIEAELGEAVKTGSIVRAEELLLHPAALETLKRLVIEAVSNFHKKNPLVRGIGKEELRGKTKTSEQVFDAVLVMLVRERRLEMNHDVIRIPGHGVVMKDDEAESKKKIEEAFASSGLKVPALPEVLAGLKIDSTRAQKIVTLLLREKTLIKISDHLVFHRSALEDLRRQIVTYKQKSPMIDVAQFKDLTGISRKYAIPLLEHLDRERVTRRKGDVREIL
jgi:selenocysteine-specific elongation factor